MTSPQTGNTSQGDLKGLGKSCKVGKLNAEEINGGRSRAEGQGPSEGPKLILFAPTGGGVLLGGW